jgi:hypothetical protein
MSPQPFVTTPATMATAVDSSESLKMWSQRPRTLKAAAEQAVAGGNLGAFIREFLDEFYALTDSEARLRAIDEEPPILNHPTANAYLAAVAEHLSLITELARQIGRSRNAAF